MKVPNSVLIQNIKDQKDFNLNVVQLVQDLVSAVNGNITFNENIGCNIQTITFSGTSEQAITHNLNRMPLGYIIATKNDSIDVLRGTTAWNGTQIYVSATAAGTVQLIIF